MKKIAILFTMLSLLGCGTVRRVDNKIKGLEDRVKTLENEKAAADALMAEFLETLKRLENELNNLTNDLGNYNDRFSTIEFNISRIESSIDLLEQAKSIGIVRIVDPCGDYPLYFDEVLLELSNGQYLVYFEDGGNRFLTTLSPSAQHYTTTDRQRCTFHL